MPKSKGIKQLFRNVKKQYTGKKVPAKYQEKYGKVYSEDETEQIGFAILNKRGMRKWIQIYQN